MFVNLFWLITCSLILYLIALFHFIRKVSRGFRRLGGKVVRRVGGRVSRAFRRVSRNVGRVQRRIAQTDPSIFQSIKNASAKHVGEAISRNEGKRIKEKDLKKEVKTKVAIEIEPQIQKSPMNEMRPLIEKTIEATIDLAILEEISKRPNQIRILKPSPVGKLVWRLIFPLATAVLVGGITYIYPDKIPPGSLIFPELQPPPPGGNPPPIDPMQIVQSIAINAAVFGVGTLILVGLIILIRRR
ncbi:MAG: hypothetical protein ACFE9R_10740 [Candidatus Hermodarchaeota archaeon]